MRRSAGLFALAALLAAPNAFAGDDVAELEALLSENVVSGASKEAETSSDAPATTTTLTAEDIRRYGLRSIDEAIDFLGMGMVTQNPLHSVEVGGRGVLITADFGNHVLLVVDGHVMNEPWNMTAYFEQGAGIPMELVDHIELILGPGSVLYGGSAMLGVVNVVTKRAASLKGAYVVAEGSASPQQGKTGAFTSFAPANLGGAGKIGAGGGYVGTLFGKPLELMGGLEMYGQNGPSFAWGPQSVRNDDGSPTNFGPRSSALGVWGGRTFHSYDAKVPTLFTRLDWNGFALMFKTSGYIRSTPYTNNFNQTRGDFDDPRNTERESWISVDLQHRARFGRWSTLAHGYFDNYLYEQRMYQVDGSQCTFPVSGTCLTDVHGRSRWAGAEAQGTYDWLGDGTLTTMAGVDARVRRIADSTRSINDETNAVAGTVGANAATEVAYAAYGQQRWSPISQLHFNVGGRYDHDPRGGDKLSPRAAIAFSPWHGGTLKAIYSEAFRAPSFYEKYYTDGLVRPAASLGAETERSAEATVEQHFGRHRLLMGVFRSWWTGLISLRTIDADTLEYQNGSKIDNYGFNARADGTVGDFAYGLSMTGAHTRRDDEDGTGSHLLTVAPQVFGNARVAYDLPGALPTVALASTFVGPRPADRAFDGGFATTPFASAQVRLRLTFSDTIKAVPGLSWRLAGEWITRGQSAYVAGPIQNVDPRNVDPRSLAQLAPVNRMSIIGTLRYDFGGP